MANREMPSLAVDIDGKRVEVKVAQADYVRAERDGYKFSEDADPGPLAVATVCFHAMKRAKRRGLIDVDVPEDFEDFLDIYEMPPDQPELPEDWQGNQ